MCSPFFENHAAARADSRRTPRARMRIISEHRGPELGYSDRATPAPREPWRKLAVANSFQQQRGVGAACEFLSKLDVEELGHCGLEHDVRTSSAV